MRILDLFRLCLFRSPYSLSFFLSLSLTRSPFLPVSFFLIYALLRARGAPARHRLGRRVSNSRQGAERNGKQRARFSEIMYAASVENLERLCTRAAFLFSPLLIPSHPFSRRSVTSKRPDAARPIRRVTRFSRQKVACVAKGEIRGKEVAMKYMFSRFFFVFFYQ